MRLSLAVLLLMGCADAPHTPYEIEPVPGLPENLWAGFQPGSWVRRRFVLSSGTYESTFTLQHDGRIDEQCSHPGRKMGYGLGGISPCFAWEISQWSETDRVETVEIDGARFACHLRHAPIVSTICGNAVAARLKNPVNDLTVWHTPDAPTPRGILKWRLDREGGHWKEFRYVSLGSKPAIEYELFWPNLHNVRGRLVLDPAVPGWIVHHRRSDTLRGKTFVEVVETVESHAASRVD